MSRGPGTLIALAFLGVAATGASSTMAQTTPPLKTPPSVKPAAPLPRRKPAAAKKQAPATQLPKLPVSIEQALYLIRTTLLTLNDANRSGNYTVLRDLAAPGFQQKNSPADLSGIFADLRKRHFNLFVTAIAAPQLTVPPRLEANGMLRLTGYFPTQPLQIKFDLLFERIHGDWRLFGISVATPPAPKPARR